MPIDKTQEPTPEEKYGPVVLRHISDEEGAETVDAAAGLDVAIDRLCKELSENDGPLEQLRLLHQAEDEWAALRALLPEKDTGPPAWGDKPVIARMEELRLEMPPLRRGIKGLGDNESSVGARFRILRRLLEEKRKRASSPS
jgi:hypothetical protein